MKRNTTLFLTFAAFILFTMASGWGCSGGSTQGENAYTVKLVKTDGTEVDTTAKPIPPSTTIQVTFEDAISTEEARTTIVEALNLYAPGETEVAGEWAWNEEFTQAVFTPSSPLAYRTQYTLDVTATTDPLPTPTLAKAIVAGSFPFTTMTRGDINGDGYADLFIGAPAWTGAQPNMGAAYVFNGSDSGVSSTYATRITGSVPDKDFGLTWSTADVNGDGYDDVIVGESGFDGKGAAYIHHGSADGISATPTTTLVGTAGDSLGYAVAGAGDVNGDGFGDVIAGAPGHDNGATADAGAAYLYHGSSDGVVSTPSSTLLGESATGLLGYFVSTAGDVNGDGVDDVCVSGNPGLGNGFVNVYLGSSSGITTTPSPALQGENAGDAFGFPCRSAGDVNGDGYDDLLVSAIGYVGGANMGALYVYHGSETGIGATPARKVLGESNGILYGLGAPAGDINGDGFDDIVVGAFGYDSSKGRAHIYHGSADGIPAAATKTIPSLLKQAFGMTSPGMDFNGDGYSDALVGAPGYDNLSSKGAAYIYYGSAAGAGDTPTMLTGETDGDFFSGWFSP